MDKTKIKEDVLQELIDLMEEKEGESLKAKFKPMQKVEVISDDKDGLEEGLEKAKEILPEEMPMDEESEEDPEDMRRLMEMYRKLK